ncbi:MAG: DUF2996 domain-containing protein [Xenococcaceae cyanobacterium]
MAEETTPNPETQKFDDIVAEAKPAKVKPAAVEAAKVEEAKKVEPAATKTAKAKAAKVEPTAKAPEAKPAKAKPAAAKAKPAKAKKPKPPALEDKPFTEFMEQHFTPALKGAFADQGFKDMELTFIKEKLPIVGASQDEQCWQVRGNWQNGQRQFNLYFLDEGINGKKAFSYATNGAQPSTIESFMIDERKVTLDLMVMYTLQRLNGQKWLTRN